MEALLARHLPWLYEHVPKRLGPLLLAKADAGDYIHDVVIQFLQYGPRIQISEDEHIRALLIRIIESALRDKHDWYTAQRRANHLEQPLPLDIVLSLDPPARSITTPSRAAELHEEEAWIRLGIELLEPDDRKLIVLRQWEGCSFKEIGGKLGVSHDTAWKKHNRAVHRLAKKVAELQRNRINSILTDPKETVY
ncbi:MAG: sigma-70 family RNA polymerase sigma factor [Planctomycetes bacterium]|nr:sigma-70 family RNA polymerase sigma factor [Planctomycetota bacterium]